MHFAGTARSAAGADRNYVAELVGIGIRLLLDSHVIDLAVADGKFRQKLTESAT